MYKEFKALVEQSSATIADCHDDYRRVCERFGIDITAGYSQSKVTDYLYAQIRSNLETPRGSAGIKKEDFFEITGDFVNRYVLLDEDPIEYLQVFNVIRDSCRTADTGLVGFSEPEKWQLAIGFAKSYNLIADTHTVTKENMRRQYPELVDRAKAIKGIQQYGFTVVFEDEDLHIPNAEKVFEWIEDKMKEIGGFRFLTILFDYLEKNGHYSNEFERYLLPARKTTLREDVRPGMPYGYLFNIAAKHPFGKAASIAEGCVSELLTISQMACNAVYAVQHYSIWRYMLNKGEGVPKLMQEIAISDSIFTIGQLNPARALKLYRYVFRKIDEKIFSEALGFSAIDCFIVAGVIWGSASRNKGPFSFTMADIRKVLPRVISDKTLANILDRLSHKGNANPNYQEAADLKNVDYFLKPFIQSVDGTYIVLQKSANVQGVFEVLADSLRSEFKKDELDSIIGKSLEEFIKQELSTKGITSISGAYRAGGEKGEADLVIETDTTILLVEIKKKVLTRAAKSGMDTSILIDLSASILDAALQSIRTELLLRRHGSLVLTNGASYVLQLNNRKIEHICVTQMEFGSLHDREIFTSFLTGLLRYKFHPIAKDDKNLNSRFDELNAKGELLRKKYEELREVNPGLNKIPFFDHWFLSINQLQDMIARSYSNSTLLENITLAKHCHFGTFDFYSENSLAFKAKDQPIDRFAAEKGVTAVHGL